MTQPVLVGLGAGAASSILFGSVLTGSLLAMVLFYLAPLPLMLAGLGWGWISALVGAAAGTLFAGASLSLEAGLVFAVACGAPAAWLTHLAMLSRGAGQAGAVEWYPPGRLVAASAIIACALAVVAMVALGPDAESFRATIGEQVETRLRGELERELEDPASVAQAARYISDLILPAMTSAWMMTIVGNLWLAGRILRTSGRLARPWPPLGLIDIPRPFVIVFAGCVAASLLPGAVGMVASAAASAWMFAYLLVGLAVLHVATRGLAARATLLAGLYFALVFFGLAAPIVALIGLGEPVFKIRARALAQQQRQQQPPPGPD